MCSKSHPVVNCFPRRKFSKKYIFVILILSSFFSFFDSLNKKEALDLGIRSLFLKYFEQNLSFTLEISTVSNGPQFKPVIASKFLMPNLAIVPLKLNHNSSSFVNVHWRLIMGYRSWLWNLENLRSRKLPKVVFLNTSNSLLFNSFLYF